MYLQGGRYIFDEKIVACGCADRYLMKKLLPAAMQIDI